jgi:hypothetical protein
LSFALESTLKKELEQLNFSLHQFESDNIEFEKKWPDLHNRLQEEIFLKGVLLGKNQNLSNQLDSLKDTYSRHIDYVKLINTKVGTANRPKFKCLSYLFQAVYDT